MNSNSSIVVAGHGSNPRGDVFASPLMFLSATEMELAYERSTICAALADYETTLAGSNVLDLGCGFGPTMAAISRFVPRQIVCVGNSPGMIECLRHIFLSDADPALWLLERGFSQVLPRAALSSALAAVKLRHSAFRTGVFRRRAGMVRTVAKEAQRLDGREFDQWPDPDVIIGNNFLHWPVLQQKAELAKRETYANEKVLLGTALVDVLKVFRGLLSLRGTAVFMVPSDFVSENRNRSVEDDILAHSMATHPLYPKFHQCFGEMLAEETGLLWNMPSSNVKPFTIDMLESGARAAEFDRVRIIYAESVAPYGPEELFLAQLPKLFGKLPLDSEAKQRVWSRVCGELSGRLAMVSTAEERALPAFVQCYYLVLML